MLRRLRTLEDMKRMRPLLRCSTEQASSSLRTKKHYCELVHGAGAGHRRADPSACGGLRTGTPDRPRHVDIPVYTGTSAGWRAIF